MLYNCHDAFDIFKSDDEEDHDDDDDINNKVEEVKQEEEFLIENSFKKEGKIRSDPFRKDEATLIHEKEEDNLENTQSADRIKSIKANVKDTNQRDYSNSPDHLESDDPRKGGKVKTEKVTNEDTENRDNLLTEELLSNKEAFCNESHVQKRSADPEVSLFESLRKKG